MYGGDDAALRVAPPGGALLSPDALAVIEVRIDGGTEPVPPPSTPHYSPRGWDDGAAGGARGASFWGG